MKEANNTLEETIALETAAVEITRDDASVGMYLMLAGGAPLLIYIGRYLLHRGQPGYDKGLFPPEKKNVLTVMVGTGVGSMLLGFMLMFVSVGLAAAAATRYMF